MQKYGKRFFESKQIKKNNLQFLKLQAIKVYTFIQRTVIRTEITCKKITL